MGKLPCTSARSSPDGGGNVRNFVAVGLNYSDHAAETGSPIPAEPILFNKAPSCIVGPNDDVVIPRGSQKTDWEVELVIVIGDYASGAKWTDANFYLGLAIANGDAAPTWKPSDFFGDKFGR